jgi:hypothetical protein
VKTENPSACATVNRKLCKSAIALYLSVIKRPCDQGANKSNHPIEPVILVTRTTLHVTICYFGKVFVFCVHDLITAPPSPISCTKICPLFAEVLGFLYKT